MEKKTLKDLTPEIEAKIPEYIARYTKGVLDGEKYNSFNQKSAEELINWNYTKCNLKLPTVLVAENPYEAQLFFNYIVANKKKFIPILYVLYCLKNKTELPKELTEIGDKGSQLYIQLDSQLDSQLYSQLRSQLDSQLDSQLYSQLRSQLYSQLGSQLDSQLDSQLRSQLDSQLYIQLDSQLDSQLRSQLYSQLRSQLDSQLDSQLGKYNPDYLFTTNVYGGWYLGWYKFIKDEFNISAEINVDLDSWNDLWNKANIYSAIFSELVCVVSKYPKKVHRNSNNDLHSTTTSSVEWGYSSEETRFNCHYVNGRNIDSNLFNKVISGNFTFDEFIKIQNEDEKGVVLTVIKENLGNEGLLNFLNAVKTDEKIVNHAGGYSETIRLFKTKERYSFLMNSKGEENQPYAWIQMTCPSTNTVYLIDTCPLFTDAIEAAKWHRPERVPKSIEYKWISAN